ncbi:GIY-YIG nuclease family protein [Rhodoplanes sp. TEM]|uniref:GIY-YIG nuclease family protein n=1 Tax=Rhodoplanes sp. TEM TaxID=3025489 RepID=UPI00234FCA9D|nr:MULTISPECIES: GIY-YIG nuclease family protein [Rhodoplanes]
MVARLTTASRAAATRKTRLSAAGLPPRPGAYVLAIALETPLPVRLAGRLAGTLAPGRYLYCGSARGPGGLRARIARHLRRRKTLRWHVDRLTTRGTVIAVWAVPDGDECALAGALAGLPVPIPGFGASDCRRCPSHLFAWPDGAALPFGPPAVSRD